MQEKQAKMLSPTHERAIVGSLGTTRYPHRDRVLFLLSIKAGLRAKGWDLVQYAACETEEEHRDRSVRPGLRTLHRMRQAPTSRAGRCVSNA